MEEFACAAELLRNYQPECPVLGVRPHAAQRAAQWFVRNFPGKVLYAVKANTDPVVLDALYRGGLRDFDVASLPEIELLSHFPDASFHVMNPVKSRRTIARAYHDFGVRDFALDSFSELAKILGETGNARDLNLYVRMKCDGGGSVLALDSKFGVGAEDASDLLLATRRSAQKLGVTFHVGSQAMVPSKFGEALLDIDRLIVRSGVLPDVIDVGGGFPSHYPDLTPPPLSCYLQEINKAFEDMCVVETCSLQCQPGRALVAEAGSVLVRVEERRGNALYINDGAYGTLFDAAHFGFVYPVRLVTDRQHDASRLEDFSLFGPTCDSMDSMKGPFRLPGNIGDGDYIEIGQLGAYGAVMSSKFNGFGEYERVIFLDEPMMSVSGDGCELREVEARGRLGKS